MSNSTTNARRTALYVCHYRTGGTDNFRWQATLAGTLAEATKAATEIRRGGRAAHVQPADVALPTTYLHPGAEGGDYFTSFDRRGALIPVYIPGEARR